jgi:hypothetical protein
MRTKPQRRRKIVVKRRRLHHQQMLVQCCFLVFFDVMVAGVGQECLHTVSAVCYAAVHLGLVGKGNLEFSRHPAPKKHAVWDSEMLASLDLLPI